MAGKLRTKLVPILCLFFCRFIDDAFLTWNQSEAALKKVLKEANDLHLNIKLTREHRPERSIPRCSSHEQQRYSIDISVSQAVS